MKIDRVPIPVVCKDTRYWRAFVSDNWENITAFVGKYKIQIQDKLYFYVPSDSPNKLHGLVIVEAVLYNCYPSDRFMELLKSRFRCGDVDIKICSGRI